MASPTRGPSPAALAAAVEQVKQLFATSFIGFAVATTAYGISVLQCYLYYRNYRTDAIHLKVTVGCLWVFDTLNTIMFAHTLYTLFVTNFGNLAADAFIPWSFALENGLLLLLAFTSFGFGLALTVHLYVPVWQMRPDLIKIPDFYSQNWRLRRQNHFKQVLRRLLNSYKLSAQAISGPVQGIAAACDIAIPLALIWCLWSKKSHGVRTTEQMIDAVILYVVCRGILTAITQIVFLVLSATFPDRTYWQPFHQIVGKLYVNSVVASLNVRDVIRGQAEVSRSIQFEHSHPTEGVGSTTRSIPLAFMHHSKTESTGSLGQGDTVEGLGHQEQYVFSDPHANDTKAGISNAI
ncbi:hypothetical protein C8J57DRAFT_1712971 [Mycena rebaudengoi]|nr:hypothetical protein C8J57DRAFT_1712971 [Mycena rebaudengoi]